MGEVPVLMDGDTTLTQSGVILDYISSKTGKLAGGRRRAARGAALAVLGQSQAVDPDRHGAVPDELPARDKRPAGVIPFLQGRLKASLYRC
jgi:glutathione S-transferase